MSSTPDSSQGLLDVGHTCSLPSCYLVDFLPIKCLHCGQSYCADHFKVDQHHCEKYDETKFNRVAPSCPLCNEPVAIPPNEDPNVRMERHFSVECSVMTGKAKKGKQPTCARSKCGKVLYAPISCDKCKQQFCASHRFPQDHNCSSLITSSKPASSNSTPAPAPSSSKPTKASTAAAMAAIKRQAASTTASAKASTKAVNVNVPNPFNKTDSSSSHSIAASNATTTNTAANDDDDANSPLRERVIDPLGLFSFTPRSIFATA